MKRFLILINLIIFGLSLGFAQSGKIIDDIYVTPNDAQMVNEVKSAVKSKAKKPETPQSTIYRNGAREIVFIDQYGNRTTAVSDTVYIVDGEMIADTLAADSIADEEGYYLNGFSGSKSDLEYAERIRRFHNPKYTITIADPGYNDIYFLDENYWNVYIDGMYATITPTWTNPYWFNYQYSPYSYNSWAWRHNWGYPYSGWGGGWYDPWYSGYYGWGGYYDPWYSGMYGWGYPYGGYYGWGGYGGWGYPYYGGYYGWGGYGGWGYPYYGGGWYDTTNQTSRRNYAGGRSAFDSNTSSRRSSVINSAAGTSRSGYTSVSRQPSATTSQRTAATTSRTTRSSYSPGVDTRMRTGSVRSTQEWSNVRSNNTRVYSSPEAGERSSSVINRTNPATRSSSVNSSSGRTYESRSSSSAPSRTYDSNSGSSRSSTPTYTPSRSSDSGSSRSSGSYSSGSSGSYSSGSSSGGASRSSGGGGRR